MHDFSRQLSGAKQGNLGHLLFRCGRLFNEMAVARVQAQGQIQMRTSHTSLFPHIDLEGTRMVELARRMGISKQAVGQLVGDLEEIGVLARLPDPEDGRAWRVVFTDKGRQSLIQGLGLLRQLEGEVGRDLGEERMTRLSEDLSALLDWLEVHRSKNSETVSGLEV